MSTIYYIDSENVGDSWIDLLETSNEQDSRFIVFYTGHSPKIAYPQAIQLMNATKKPEFIACHEGNNGLDFQLVTYLGYELCANSTNEMVIVSKDTGFDAAVLFWKERGMNVKRQGKCSSTTQSYPPPEPVLDTASVTEVISTEEICNDENSDNTELFTIINCVGKKELASIHLFFTHFYGNKNGEMLYKQMKAIKFAVPSVNWTKDTKLQNLTELIIKYASLPSGISSQSLSDYICQNVVSDSKTMANKLGQQYKDNAQKINKAFKPFYKTLAKVKKK